MLDIEALNKKMSEWFDSEEGKKSMEEFFEKIKNKNKTIEYQLEKFHKRNNFEEFITKVINKYDSPEYRDKWYKRGIEPPEYLYWFLFEYAKKYGRKCNRKEWKKHSNTFTSDLFFCNGYYFNLMIGQGSVINIIKQKDEK